MANKRKYYVNYYGWIPHYGDWDCDDFIVRAKNMKEARQLADERLKGYLLKHDYGIQLYSTHVRKMKEYEENRLKLLNNKNK